MMQRFHQEMISLWRSMPKEIAALFVAVLVFSVGSAILVSNYTAADAAMNIFTMFCMPLFICVKASAMLGGEYPSILPYWDTIMQIGIVVGFLSYWLLPKSSKNFSFYLPVIVYGIGAAYWKQICPEMADTSFFQRFEILCLLCVFPTLFAIIAARVLEFAMDKTKLSISTRMIIMGITAVLLVLVSAAGILTFERYLYLFACGWFILLPAPFVYGAAKIIYKI